MNTVKKVLYGVGAAVVGAVLVGCATSDPRVDGLETKVAALERDSKKINEQIEKTQKWSDAAFADLEKSLTGKTTVSDKQTEYAGKMQAAIAVTDDLGKAVDAYRQVAGLTGFDPKKAADAITQKHLMDKVKDKTDIKEVFAIVDAYAAKTGAKVSATPDGGKIYVSGEFGEATIAKDAAGKYAASTGYSGNVGDIGKALTEANYQKLTGGVKAEKRIADAKGLDQLVAISDAVKEGNKTADDLEKAVGDYLTAEKPKLGIHVDIPEKGDAMLSMDMTVAYNAGALTPEQAIAVMRGIRVKSDEATVEKLIRQGSLQTGTIDVLGAFGKYDCNVMLYRATQ